MNVLICICASNRPQLLNKTLYSLKQLNKTPSVSLFVYVIDNDIYSGNKKIIDKFKKKKLSIFYKLELRKGIVYARNKFLNSIEDLKIKFDYIGFIDDDCEADLNWLTFHLKYLQKSSFNISTGPQNSKKKIGKNQIFFNLTNKYINKDITQTYWAATNNVIMKYEILKKHSIKFDLNLNKIGGSDQLFFLKHSKLGNKILWNKKAIVRENTKNKNINHDWFIKRNIRYGFSGAYINKVIYGTFFGFLISILRVTFFLIRTVPLILLFFYNKNIFRIEMNLMKIYGILKYYFGKKIDKYN